jgi:hypothetical protein
MYSQYLSQNVEDIARDLQARQVSDKEVKRASAMLVAAKRTLIANGVDPDKIYGAEPGIKDISTTQVGQKISALTNGSKTNGEETDTSGQKMVTIIPDRPVVEGSYREDSLEAAYDTFKLIEER